MSEEDQNRLLRGYEQMLRRLREMMADTDALTRPNLADAIDTAKEEVVESGQLERDEADRIGGYLWRDLSAAAEVEAGSREDLAQWAHMDLQLIEDWLLDTVSKVVDQSRVELIDFQRQMTESARYEAGEITGPGSLYCLDCGQPQRMGKISRITPCPECGSREFGRQAPE